MAWIIPIANSDATTTDLASDNLYIARQILFGGVSGNESNQQVIIDGTIATAVFDGVQLNGAGADVRIGATGIVRSFNSTGVAFQSSGSSLINDGSIYGGSNGVYLFANGNTQVDVVNSGTIEGANVGFVKFGGAETVSLENTGTIKGGIYAYQQNIISTVSTDNIVNSGLMVGTIEMGAGNDLYDGRLGKVVGTVYGGAGEDTIYGGKEANIIHGGTEADVMSGGRGDDTFYVDMKTDKVFEVAGQGTDTVFTSASYDLSAGVSVELLQVLSPTSTVATLVGNEFAQTIIGGDGANAINGRAGNDTLIGGDGNDSFYFDRALNAANNVDTLTDFYNVSGNNDTIRLENAIFTALTTTGTLSAAAFRSNATGIAADLDDRIIFETDTGKVFYDADGNTAGGVAGIHFATISTFASLTGSSEVTSADFLIY